MELTIWYWVASISKDNGYGLSVIGKLLETPVKKNLYYEIKDRVLEETTDGNRIIRNKRKTKVYGLTSTNNVRDLLIEILRERVTYHKDKFISPSIYQEMRGLEVKRNGKIEHSALTHDDQIFSYLVGLYVWYEGKNLRELFGIEKSSIKTEDDIDEILDMGIDENMTDITQEIEYINRSDDDRGSEVQKQMGEMQKAVDTLFGEYMMKQRKQETALLREMLQNPVVREAYARKYKINPDDVSIDDEYSMASNNNNLPTSVFLDFNKDEDEMSQSSIYNLMNAGERDLYYENNREDNGLQ